MTSMTQHAHFYLAHRRTADINNTFFEMVNSSNPLTREDLETNIKRRPALWGRFSSFLDKLPSRKGERQ